MQCLGPQRGRPSTRRRALLAAVAGAALHVAHGQPLGFNYSTCAPPGLDNSLAAGDTAYLCVAFNGATRGAFNVKVDAFSAVQLSSSNTYLPAGSGFLQDGVGWIPAVNRSSVNCSAYPDPTVGLDFYAAFDVTVNSVSSPYPRMYKSINYNPCFAGAGSTIYTVPIYTAIVGMDNGVITYVSWDDGCFFCAYNGDSCVHTALNVNGSATGLVADDGLRGCREDASTCYTAPASPSATAAPSVGASPAPTPAGTPSASNASTSGLLSASTCDLRVYVCWTGTDRNGKFLTSAGQRFSRYRAFGAATLYQGVLNGYDASKNVFSNALNVLQAVPGQVTNGRRLGAAGAAAATAAGGLQPVRPEEAAAASGALDGASS